jgi:alpha-ketoglutarate-dependent taurine dioxygenase
MKPFVSIYEVSADEVWDDVSHYANLLAERKALVFKEMRPSRVEHARLLELLYQGEALDEDLAFGTIRDEDHSVMLNDGEFFNGQPLVDRVAPKNVRNGWHTDFPFREKTPSLTSMHMTKCDIPPGSGRTWLLDLEQMYYLLPPDTKVWLNDKSLEHRTGNYVNVADRDREPQEGENEYGEAPGCCHPAVRLHPVTKNPCLFYSGHTCEIVGSEDDERMFAGVKSIMKRAMLCYDETAPYLYAHEWSAGDLMIWDNRNLLHTFEGGWTVGTRIFDKVEYAYEKP